MSAVSDQEPGGPTTNVVGVHSPMNAPPVSRLPRNAWICEMPVPEVAVKSRALPLITRLCGTSWSPGLGLATVKWMAQLAGVDAIGPELTSGCAAAGSAGNVKSIARPTHAAQRRPRILRTLS